jgi:hypothetical protein
MIPLGQFDFDGARDRLGWILTTLWKGIFLVVGTVVGVLGVCAAISFLIWRERRRRAERQAAAARIGPDGKPYPPAGPGLCDCCRRAFDKVYYLPGRRRLCPECYAGEMRAAPEAGGDSASPTPPPGAGDAPAKE